MARRLPSEPAPHLAWRVRLFSGAAILVVLGMYADVKWPIWGAIGLLAVAFALRFVGGGETAADELDPVESDPDTTETLDDEV